MHGVNETLARKPVSFLPSALDLQFTKLLLDSIELVPDACGKCSRRLIYSCMHHFSMVISANAMLYYRFCAPYESTAGFLHGNIRILSLEATFRTAWCIVVTCSRSLTQKFMKIMLLLKYQMFYQR